MRTSLTEIKRIDDFLTGKLAGEESLLLRAKMILDPVLKRNVQMQKKILRAVKIYGRKRLRSEIEELHVRIFKDNSKVAFQREIYRIFKNGK